MAGFGERPKVRIIRMRKVPFVDSTGIHNLTNSGSDVVSGGDSGCALRCESQGTGRAPQGGLRHDARRGQYLFAYQYRTGSCMIFLPISSAASIVEASE